MAVSRKEKEEILSGLKKKFQEMNGAVFVDYRGMTVEKVYALRSELNKVQMRLKVAKKTLIRKAAEAEQIDGYDDAMLSGPTAVAIANSDVLELAKIIKKFTKTDDHLKILGGIVDKKIVGPDFILQLAALPSKAELLAKMLYLIKSPLSGFVQTAKNPVRGFMQVMKQLSEKQ